MVVFLFSDPKTTYLNSQPFNVLVSRVLEGMFVVFLVQQRKRKKQSDKYLAACVGRAAGLLLGHRVRDFEGPA